MGSLALKVNLFSALFACLTLVILFWTAIRLLCLFYPNEEGAGFVPAAFLSAGLLAFALPFWNHSLVAEVYTLNSFFICLVILLLLLWRQKEDIRFLYAGALVYGLSSGNHATVAFLLPAILVLFLCWCRQDRARHLFIASVFFLIGFSVYAYLPLRSLAEPSMDFGNPETLKGFLYQITDRKDADTHFSHFRESGLTGENSPSISIWAILMAWAAKVWRVAHNLVLDVATYLSPAAVLGAFAGAWVCWRKNRPLFFFTLIVVAVNASFFVNWMRESFFPSYIVVCLFTAVAVYAVLFRRAENDENSLKGAPEDLENPVASVQAKPAIDWRRLVYVGLLCVIPWNILANYHQADRSGSYFGESLLKRTFLSLEDNSLFITGMSWFNFYYHHDVMRLRDDVTGIKAWDLLDPEPPSYLTTRRYPDLNLPDPSHHQFDSRLGTYAYVQDLLQRNHGTRPILMDQNVTFFEQLPLENEFAPYRNLLLKYRPSSSENNREDATGLAFAEFKEFLNDELKIPGIFNTEWILKVTFYIPSFAAYYHNTGRYQEERDVLKLTYEFLGLRGLDWQFKQVDNLILDGQVKQARQHFNAMQNNFPDHYRTRLMAGLLLRAEGKLSDSITSLEEAAKLAPEAFRPQLELGRSYFSMGEREKASLAWERARENVQSLPELMRLRAQMTS